MNGHRASTKSEDKMIGCKYLHQHYTSGPCKNANFNIQIIDNFEGNGRDPETKTIDTIQSRLRRETERDWIKELRTLYPFGLNIRLDGDHKTGDNHSTISKFHIPKKYNNRKRGNKRGKCRINITSEDIIKNLINPNITNKEFFAYCRKVLFGLPKRVMKKVASELIHLSNISDHNIQIFKLEVALDIIDYKLIKPRPEKSKKSTPELICKVFFDNKTIEMINLPRIFNLAEVKNKIPTECKIKEAPMVVYKLCPTIRSKVFNYKETITNLNVNEYLSNSITCDCESNDLNNTTFNHVITGDLSIIKNSKLRKLFSKGPNYRECKSLNWKAGVESISQGIDDLILCWCSKEKLKTTQLDDWKNEVLKHIQNQVKSCKKRYKAWNIARPTLKDPIAVKELEHLKEKYVIVPVDKANRNISFICKKFYIDTLLKELGIHDTTLMNPTYIDVQDDINKIVENHKKEIGDMLPNESIKDDMLTLPYIYWIPKFHKNPIKARFIVASSKCTSKVLSNKITLALKLIEKQHRFYCDKLKTYTGLNRMWIIHNSSEIHKDIYELNQKDKNKTIDTFDFSTLYTMIEHADLKEAMQFIIDKAYYGSRKEFISIYNNSANWTHSPKQTTTSVTNIELFEIICYLIDNIYFRCGERVFRQKIGIPMGTDCAPFLANLYLYYHEFKFMEKISKTDYKVAKKFNHSHRYIDDLASLNNDGYFQKYAGDIYPDSLKLNKENKTNKEASFLDTSIEIRENRFITKLYDKRDAFDFEIVNYPNLSGNLPKKTMYGVFISQIVRYSIACMEYENFINRCNQLTTKLKGQGYEVFMLKLTLKKTLMRYPNIKTKYNTYFDSLCNQLSL